MLRALHAQPDLSERFTAFLLKRNIGLEEDLCDQLFNPSEKPLARVLLLKFVRLRRIRGRAGCHNTQIESRDPGRNGRHDAVAHYGEVVNSNLETARALGRRPYLCRGAHSHARFRFSARRSGDPNSVLQMLKLGPSREYRD